MMYDFVLGSFYYKFNRRVENVKITFSLIGITQESVGVNWEQASMGIWEESLKWCQGSENSRVLLGYVKFISHQAHGNVLWITEWNCSNHEAIPCFCCWCFWCL